MKKKCIEGDGPTPYGLLLLLLLPWAKGVEWYMYTHWTIKTVEKLSLIMYIFLNIYI